MSILQVNELTAGYGAQDVLFGVSLTIDFGEIVAVMGPNGSGKSTLLKVISGALPARQGEILYKGQPLLGRSPQQIVQRGLSWVPQEENIFPSLTVRENLEIGAHRLKRGVEDRIDERFVRIVG